jgi:hypothetical protein
MTSAGNVKTGELHTEWHGISAGTRVRIIRVGKDWQGCEIAAVEREDGGLLPLPSGGEGRVSVVANNFIAYDRG